MQASMRTSTYRPGIIPGTVVFTAGSSSSSAGSADGSAAGVTHPAGSSLQLTSRMGSSSSSSSASSGSLGMSLPLGSDLPAATILPSRVPPATLLGATNGMGNPARQVPYTGHPSEGLYDERVMVFRAYFNESIPESARETWRARLLVLKFYLGDATTEIFEPDTKYTRNDGILHGKFLKRAPLAGLDRSNFASKLRVNGFLEVHGKVLHFHACDKATRAFFEDLGEPQDADFEAPVDAYTTQTIRGYKSTEAWYGIKTSSITRFLEASQGCQRDFKGDAKARYMKYDGVYLRLLLLWSYMDGTKLERIKYWLTYYLATRDCEMVEEKGQRSYMTAPMLLKRVRLPRKLIAHDDRARSCEDFDVDSDYYNEHDFIVGNTVNIFGRDMLICDCEPATAEWYLTELGIDQVSRRVDIPVELPPKIEFPVPPHMGIGSEEDTLNSLKSLIPKQPRKDWKNRTGLSVRFKAHLVTSDPIDRSRQFTIIYYADDKEVGVYEHSIRNSGVLAGSFMRKTRLRNSATGEFFELDDFEVGKNVLINAFTFHVEEFESSLRQEDIYASTEQTAERLRRAPSPRRR